MTGSSEGVDTSAIALHGDQAAKQDIPNVYDRFADLELRLEQLGKNAEMVAEVVEYVRDLRAEAKTLRLIRWLVLAAASALIVALLGSLGYLIFCRPFLFFTFGGPARVALITSIIAGVVLLTTLVIKGVFRTLADRHADEPLSPHLQLLVEAAKSAIKPGA